MKILLNRRNVVFWGCAKDEEEVAAPLFNL